MAPATDRWNDAVYSALLRRHQARWRLEAGLEDFTAAGGDGRISATDDRTPETRRLAACRCQLERRDAELAAGRVLARLGDADAAETENAERALATARVRTASPTVQGTGLEG